MSVPGTVGVLGGGRMGAGIAHAFLLAGARVRLVERDDASADAARARAKRVPVRLGADPDRRHQADTGHHDSPVQSTSVPASDP